jgi:ATP:ADP antiporter, AAA family
MKERLYSILNLKASETNYVFDLLSIQLFIGIANSFINIVSFTLFIHHFSIDKIAYGYIAIAVVLSFLNLGYEKLEKKLSPLHLLRWIIIGSCIVLLAFWIGLLTIDQGVMIFSLLVLGTLFYMVTGYAYWGLVSLLFNIRESRRVFSIVGSGDIPAKLTGYVSAPLLIPIIGLENLLLLSLASLLIGFLLLNKLIHKKRWERIIHRTHVRHVDNPLDHHKTGSVLSFFFKHKLIFTISFLSLISYNVFNLTDYTFITQIKAKIQNLSALSTYIAIFFAVGRLTAFILKIVFTSRLIERLGVISCLLITPVILTLFSGSIILSRDGANLLYIIGLMAMITEVLRSAMQEPVFFILFQPLNEHYRLRGHIIAKGYMLAPSLLIVGATLIAMQRFHVHLSIDLTVKILLLNLGLWVGIIFYIRNAYLKALHQSIAKGTFSGDVFKINDPATISILLQKIEKGNSNEKIYALKLLEQSDYKHIDQLLEQEILSGETNAKRYALRVMEKRNTINTELLTKLIENETDTEVKEDMIMALCKVDPRFLYSFSQNLPSLDYNIRKNLIILLLNQNEFVYLFRAGHEINSLLVSSLPQERELAIQIISELKNIKFTEAIEVLINDAEPSVKRNAIIAACKLKNKAILPFAFARLKNQQDKFIIIQGLFQYGDTLFEDIKELEQVHIDAHKNELIKIATKVKGPLSMQFLLRALNEENPFEEKIIHALWAKAYQVVGTTESSRFQALLRRYLLSGLKKIGYHNAVPVLNESELIKRSIGNEIWNDLTTSLKLCAILYAKKEIDRVIELVENKDRHKLFNAMEMLEMVLPKKVARHINNLFDYVLEPVHGRKKQNETNTLNFLHDIMVTQDHRFNHWTKAMCLYISLKNNKLDFIRNLSLEPEPNENIVLTETRAYVLTSIQPPLYVNH